MGDTLDAFSGFDYGQILLIKVVESYTGSLPTAFKSAYKCLVCTPIPSDSEPTEGDTLTVTLPSNTDRFVIAFNFRNNRIPKDSFHLAFKVGKVYVLDNQNSFMEAL